MTKKRAHLTRKAARTRKQVARRGAAAATKKAAAVAVAATFPRPAMKAGEEYAGVMVDATTGKLSHLVEIARRTEAGTQAEQIAWAKSVGGTLPDKSEGFQLLANRRHAFKEGYYWTREDYPGNAQYAYVQYFRDGYQNDARKDDRCLACAVRRVPI